MLCLAVCSVIIADFSDLSKIRSIYLSKIQFWSFDHPCEFCLNVILNAELHISGMSWACHVINLCVNLCRVN